MSTQYSIIDNSFLNKITDGYLVSIKDELLQELIDGYRKAAISKFKQCTKLEDRDDSARLFAQDLTDEEIEIVANLMVLEWLRGKINSVEVLKQKMSTKDYKIFSQSRHLDSLLALKNATMSEVDALIVSYTYSTNSLDDLRKV